MYINNRLESSTGELEEGQLSQDKGVGHLQPEKSASRMRELELELAEAREAKERLEENMRGLVEELQRK